MGQGGEILSSFRNLKEGHQLSEGMLLHVVKFWEKYVKLNFRDKNCKKEWKDLPHLSLPDMITNMEFAYSIVLFESMKRIWDQDIEYRALSDKAKKEFSRGKVPKYHCGTGTMLPLGQSSMTQGVVVYLKAVSNSIGRLRLTSAWKQLNTEWWEYSKKYHSTFFRAVQGADYHQGHEDLVEFEDDEEDHEIELPDDASLLDQQRGPLDDGIEMDDMSNDDEEPYNQEAV